MLIFVLSYKKINNMKKTIIFYFFLSVLHANSLLGQEYVGCTQLRNLHLPSCTAIGDSAFISCISLENLHFPHCAPPTYGKDAFPHPETIQLDLGLAYPEMGYTDPLLYQWMDIPEWEAFIFQIPIGIQEVAISSKQIYVDGRSLKVSGLETGNPVTITSLSGIQHVYFPSREGTLELSLPVGTYVIREGKNTHHIVVTSK